MGKGLRQSAEDEEVYTIEHNTHGTFSIGQMRKMVLEGKISDYYMYNNANNQNSATSCQYPIDASNGNCFTPSNNCDKNQLTANGNPNYQSPKFPDRLASHWNESIAAMHQQAHQDPNYFRNQYHFNGAVSNSYHVNDSTIPNIPTAQFSQNQHCLLIPHTHFHHPVSTGKSILFGIIQSRDKKKRNK